MITHFRASVSKRFAKIVNIAALVSMLASLFTFAPMVAVHAAPVPDPLTALSTTLAQPIFSADWDTDPSYTNVTYSFTMTGAMQANTGDACMTTNDCFIIYATVQGEEDNTQGSTSTHQYQEWRDTILTGDIIWNGPANSSIATITRGDGWATGVMDQLALGIDCSATCVFATSTAYSFTIKNSPLKNPETFANPPPGFNYMSRSHIFLMDDGSAANQNYQGLTSIVAIGGALTVTASVDASLSFYIEGAESTSFFGEPGDEFINNSAADDTCDFGTLTPGVPKYCNWLLAIATNASNGYSIYVVQDQNMTFNGNTIKQFDSAMVVDDDRLDDSAATTWQPPESAALAHLGYSSNDPSVFVNSAPAEWAGIPTIATAGQAPVTTGLVCESASPGGESCSYAIKIESASTLPQGTGYTHNEYFLVVGNF